jgi:GR25 family glycosyltransferase involved in LPS biosynthesis
MIPIVIINLERDQDRLQRALKQLEHYPVTRYPAVNGKDVDLQQVPISLYTRHLIQHPCDRCSHQQINSLGGVGCYLSHCSVWNTYKDSPSGVIVFEDDLQVCRDFDEKFDHVINHIPPDCDVLSFGYLKLLEKNNLIDDVTKSDAFFFGTQGYYISPAGMKKLLDYAFPMEVHLDAYIALAAKHGVINLYFTKKSLVQQCHGISNITHEFCYKCLLPNCSVNTLIYIGLGLVLIIFIYVILRFRRK